MTRVRFEVKGTKLYAEHPEHGMVKVLSASTADELREKFETTWHGIAWTDQNSGTFEAFTS